MIALGSIIAPARSPRAGKVDFPVLSMTMHSGLVDQADKFKKRIASEDTSAYKIVSRGQLVVGFPIDEGVLSFQKLYDKAIVSPAYAVWDISLPDVDKNYLEKFLRSPIALKYYASKLRSTTARRRSIPQDTFLELPVPLPPLDEQMRIAAILDKADLLRQKRLQAIALLDSLTQSIFLEMFGDPVNNPKGWPTAALGPLQEVGPNFGSMQPPSKEVREWISLRVANIQNWEITLADTKYIDLNLREIARFTLRDGDIILARAIASQEHLGKCVVVSVGTTKLAFDSHLMRIRLNQKKILPEFLREFLRTPGGRTIFLKSTRKTTVQYNINTKELNAIKIPLPPLDKQRQFVEQLNELSAIRLKLDLATKSEHSLFASLQHRAFTGQL